MKVQVEMHAFQPGIFRTVEIPDSDPAAREDVALNHLLEAVYLYGQNDIQLVAGVCSVSCGDIIHLSGERFQIISSGFKHLLLDETPLTMFQSLLARPS